MRVSWRIWLNQTFGRSSRRPARQYQTYRPRLEILEDRLAPAVMELNYVIAHDSAGALNSGPTPQASGGFTPAQLRHAYGFDQVTFSNGTIQGDGTGQTIAIVDAYNQPNIASDLATFDAAFGLPAPPSFQVVNQTGGSTLPTSNADWGLEISLDVEWAHAMAPGANIVLVEASSATDTALLAAVDTASKWSVNGDPVCVVSMSWGSQGEATGETSNDTHFQQAGVTYVASSGDSGQGVEWPSISAYVLSVGGTSLTVDSNNNWLSESGWSGSGGGISSQVSQPGYQVGWVTQSSAWRTNPDVAFDADPNTGVAVYDDYDPSNEWGGQWVEVGGTSAGAPQWSALVAITNQGRAIQSEASLTGYAPTQSSVPQTLPKIYRLPSADLHDITSGSNGYNAGPGYDLVTGMGSPVANLMVPDLINDTPVPANLRISAMNLKAGSTAITYASPGETVTVQPTVVNVGQLAASNATIQLLTSTPGVTIVGFSTQSLPTVNPGTPVQPASAFQIQLSSNISDLTQVQLNFVLSYNSGQQQTVTETFYISAPKPQAEQKVNFIPGALFADPYRDVVYLIDLSDLKVLAINTDNGQTVGQGLLAANPTINSIPGSDPVESGQMAESLDGTRLYVALDKAQEIQEFSLPGLVPVTTFSFTFQPVNLVCGPNNMLYASTHASFSNLQQINGLTGAVLGNFGKGFVNGQYSSDALMRVSADGNHLYATDLNLYTTGGPNYIYQYDISGATPVLLTKFPYDQENSNDFAVDEGRGQIYTMNGGPTNGSYGVELTNMATDGYFTTWPLGQPYGEAVALIPGNQDVYAAALGGTIVRYLAQDGTPIGSYTAGKTLTSCNLPNTCLKITPNGNLMYLVNQWTGTGNPNYYFAIGIIGCSTLNITTNPGVPLTLSPSTPLPDGEYGLNYRQTITASGGNGSYTYSASGSLPPGLTLSSGGLLSGIATTAGTYNFSVTAIDTVGDSGSQAYTVTIHAPPTITTTSLNVATVQDSYRQVLTYIGGSGTGYTFGENGVLPAGLSFNTTTGTLSGTPTQAGTFSITVTLTDSLGGTASLTYSLTVDPAITFTPTTLSSISAGSAYTQAFTATGGAGGPYSFGLTFGSLPPGLSLSGNQITGTPTTAGSYLFILTASDSINATGSQAYQLTVTNPSTTTLAGPATTVSGQPATFKVSVTGSGPTPTGLVTLYDGNNIIASGSLNNGSVSFQTSTLTLGSHTLTAVYNGDSNYAGSISTVLAVTVLAPNVSDSFGSGNGPLDPSWTVAPNPALTPAGAFAIQNGQAVATGPNFNSAIFSDFTPSDVGVGAFVDVSAATGSAPIYAGLQARLDNNGNSYVGLIASNGSSNLLILGLARGTGVLTFFSVVPIGATSSGNLRLEVFGTTLKLYLEGTLMASATDATLTAPGGVGLFSEASPGAKYGGFFAYQLQASPTIYADGFSQSAVPASTTLGAPWSVDQGGFTVNSSNQAVAAGVQSEATLYGAQLTTVDESVSVISAGTSAGLLARWNSATQTGYELVVTGTTVALYRVQNGTATLLQSAGVSGSTGTLRLLVSGSSIKAYFGGSLLFTVTDSTITGPGTAGLFSGGGAALSSYIVVGS